MFHPRTTEKELGTSRKPDPQRNSSFEYLSRLRAVYRSLSYFAATSDWMPLLSVTFNTGSKHTGFHFLGTRKRFKQTLNQLKVVFIVNNFYNPYWVEFQHNQVFFRLSLVKEKVTISISKLKTHLTSRHKVQHLGSNKYYATAVYVL